MKIIILVSPESTADSNPYVFPVVRNLILCGERHGGVSIGCASPLFLTVIKKMISCQFFNVGPEDKAWAYSEPCLKLEGFCEEPTKVIYVFKEDFDFLIRLASRLSVETETFYIDKDWSDFFEQKYFLKLKELSALNEIANFNQYRPELPILPFDHR